MIAWLAQDVRMREEHRKGEAVQATPTATIEGEKKMIEQKSHLIQ